jgi:galactokinase
LRKLRVSAPGRICLFGEHQDFLGLPVIAAAINLRFYIQGIRRQDSYIRFSMPDIDETDELNLLEQLYYRGKRDYLRSSINVLRKSGWSIEYGWDCVLWSKIPINAGVSSSSAMTVAWLCFLLESADGRLRYSSEDIARLAHQAEVVEFGEPGGMMDHFASALGGIIYVDCRPPFHVHRLTVELDGLVLGDSLEKKETLDVLASSKHDVLKGLRFIAERYSNFDLYSTQLAEVEHLIEQLPEAVARKVRANFVNRDLTREALDVLLSNNIDQRRLGKLLTLHHEQLRDGIGVSTPKIDRMVEAALDAGAVGAKINGSGGGGCMFAYAPGSEDAVVEALERVGGKAYKVKVDEGVRVEESVY